MAEHLNSYVYFFFPLDWEKEPLSFRGRLLDFKTYISFPEWLYAEKLSLRDKNQMEKSLVSCSCLNIQ